MATPTLNFTCDAVDGDRVIIASEFPNKPDARVEVTTIVGGDERAVILGMGDQRTLADWLIAKLDIRPEADIIQAAVDAAVAKALAAR